MKYENLEGKKKLFVPGGSFLAIMVFKSRDFLISTILESLPNACWMSCLVPSGNYYHGEPSGESFFRQQCVLRIQNSHKKFFFIYEILDVYHFRSNRLAPSMFQNSLHRPVAD